MSDKLIILDTTLRDGEQSAGVLMNKYEKVRIAKMLEKMGVDIIEAGFAIVSPGEFEAIQLVSNAVKDSTVCSLARALDKDNDCAGQALKGANSSRIHTFIATSDIHMKMKL
jgi:2-isopropylmalate synthase